MLLLYVFAATIGVVALLAIIAIWAPRKPVVRFSALAATILVIPLGYLQLTEMLSRPKPVEFEWFRKDVEQAQLLGVSLDEGRANLYVGCASIRKSSLGITSCPGNQQTAEKLEDLIDNALRHNSTIILKKPFIREFMDDMGDLNANIVPPPLPPQKLPSNPPQIFNPRQQNI